MPTCPHCGHEADAPAGECPLCGTPLDAGDERVGRGGPGRTASGSEAPPGRAGGPVPWEDPEEWIFGGLATTWKNCLFEPERVFAALDYRQSLARPLLYYLLITVVSGFFSLLWQTVLQTVVSLPAGGRQAGADLLLSFFLTPFVFLFLLLVGGGLVHLSALLVAGGGTRTAGSTYRVVCYAASPLLLGIVPVVGSVLAPGWSLVVMVLGLREVHRTNTGRAVLAALIPLVVFVVGLLLLAVLVFSASQLGDFYAAPM